MKNEYTTPEIEIISISESDIITASNPGGGVIVTPEDEF